MKGLRQNILDFEILQTGNPKTMVFLDSSDYKDEQPDKPLLEVTFPGYNKYFIVNVKARSVNTFNSNTLGLTDLLNNDEMVDLPDGLYKLRYKICPYTTNFKDKVYFRTTLLEAKLGRFYNKLLTTDCSKSEDKTIGQSLTEINMLLAGIPLVASVSAEKAQAFYTLANSLVDKMDKCCN